MLTQFYKRIMGKITILLLLVSMIAVSIPVNASEIEEQFGITYYVDSIGGDDANNGTSQESAWKSLEKVNSTIFQPGDKVLFKSGCIWDGQLWPKGSGVEGKPITVGKYGDGILKPIISGSGTVANAVYLYNQEYWEISNLEITNDADTPGDRRGICVFADNGSVLNHIYLKYLTVHNVKGEPGKLNGNSFKAKLTGGIYVYVNDKTPTRYNDVLIEGCHVYSVDRTAIGTYNSTVSPDYKHTNVRIRNNTLEDIGGDGIVLRGADAGIVEYNVAKECNKRATAGIYNVPFWPSGCKDTIYQYNEAYLTKEPTGDNDGYGFDIDNNNTGCILQYNYSHDNDGGFMLFTSNTDCVARYNISQNDKHRIFKIGSVNNAKIYNNTIYIGEEVMHVVRQNSSNADGVGFYNNIFYNIKTSNGYEIKGKNVVFDYNVFYGQHHETEPADEHKIIADPRLVAPGTGGTGIKNVDGYRLKPHSPCINSGKVIDNNGGMDYWGNSLYRNEPDRGAHEFRGLGKGVEQSF